MKAINSCLRFGEAVEGYNTPVLNEREIRAAAGILFLAMAASLARILFEQNFLLIKYVVVAFLTDFLIRVCVSPRFSPTLVIGRLIVSSQVPEYVSAPPKKFAWTIGLTLSGVMFILLVLLNAYSIITVVVCFTCLGFLFFETAFGICLGCITYGWFYKTKFLHCAGEACAQTTKQEVQITSRGQVLSLIVFMLYLLLISLFLNDHLSKEPGRLWNMLKWN